MKCITCTVIAALSLIVNTACAGVYFAEDFDSGTVGPYLTDLSSAYTVSGGVATTSTRAYLRTNEAGYLDRDFIADLVYTQNADSSGQGGVFFGIGAALKNPNFFDEPYPAVFTLDLTNDFFVQGVVGRVWPDDGSVIESGYEFFSDSTPRDGLARQRITKLGTTLTFDLDLEYDGSNFAPQMTASIDLGTDATFLNSSNSYLFFGSGLTSSSFDSFSVTPVPEPTTFAIWGVMGLAGFGGIRRRRNRLQQDKTSQVSES